MFYIMKLVNEVCSKKTSCVDTNLFDLYKLIILNVLHYAYIF